MNEFDEIGLPERYEVQRLAGRGAFAVVYEAFDQILQRRVAIKIADSQHILNPKFSARWHREITLNARIQHPRIVSVFDIGHTANQRPYVSMAFAAGGDLSALLRKSPSRRIVLNVIIDALDGLAELHSYRIIHQDIKPDNILIDANGQGLVADLGVSATRAELTINPQGIAGTPEFMAPEQQQRLPQEMGPWTDLYAIGRILSMLEVDQGPLQPITDIILQADPLMRLDCAADLKQLLQDLLHTASSDWLESLIEKLNITLPKSRQSQQFQKVRSDCFIPWRQLAIPELPLEQPLTAFTGTVQLPLYQDPPLVGRADILSALWESSRQTILTQQTQVVLLLGPQGVGKTRIMATIARSLEAGGWMARLLLRYHSTPSEDDGYHGAIRELLSPIENEPENFIIRVQRYLSRMYGISIKETESEARSIAHWCGFSGDVAVNSATGLLLLYQWLRCYSWRGGVCLTLDHPQRSVVSGDGLDICDALLSEGVGRMPVFVMATISSEDYAASPQLQQRVEHLRDQGAKIISVGRLNGEDIVQMVTQSYGLKLKDSSAIEQFCSGLPSRLILLMRYWRFKSLLSPKSADEVILNQPLEDVVPASDKILSEAMFEALMTRVTEEKLRLVWLSAALAQSSISLLLLRQIDSQAVDTLMSLGVIRQKERRLSIEPDVLIGPLKSWGALNAELPVLHAQLAEAWSKLKLTRYYSDQSIGFHLLAAQDPKNALPHLLRASRQALNDGRYTLCAIAAKLAYDAASQIRSHMATTESLLVLLESQVLQDVLDDASSQLSQLETLCANDLLSGGRLKWLKSLLAFQDSDFERSKSLLQNAEKDLKLLGDNQHLSKVHLLQGKIYLQQGELLGASDRLARNISRNHSNVVSQQSLYFCTVARILLGWKSGLPELLKREVMHSRQQGNIEAVAWGMMAQGVYNLAQHKKTLSLRHFQAAYAASVACGQRDLSIEALTFQGLALLLSGQPQEAHVRYLQLADSCAGRGDIKRQLVANVLALICWAWTPNKVEIASQMDRLSVLQVQVSKETCVWFQLLKVWVHQHHGREKLAKENWQQAISFGCQNIWDPQFTIVLAALLAQKTELGSFIKVEYDRFQHFLPVACFLSLDDVA